jgi:hypothetical protein
MEYKKFREIGKLLEDVSKRTSKLYDLNIDLINYSEPYDTVVSLLMQEIYGEIGMDWWSWFCYENDFGKNDLEASDENGNRICYSWKSLHSFLEKNYKRTK